MPTAVMVRVSPSTSLAWASSAAVVKEADPLTDAVAPAAVTTGGWFT